MNSSSSESASPQHSRPRRDLPLELLEYLSQRVASPCSPSRPRKRQKLGGRTDHIVIHRSYVEINLDCGHSMLDIALEKSIVPNIRRNWTGSVPATVEYVEVVDDTKKAIFHVPVSPHDEDIQLALQVFADLNTIRGWPSLYASVSISLRPHGTRAIFRLHATLKWTLSSSEIVQSKAKPAILFKILNRYFPDRNAATTSWSPQDFYSSVNSLPKNDEDAASIRVPGLEAELYPFQRRAVQWLLRKEGVAWGKNGGISPTTAGFTLPDSFIPVRDADGQSAFVSHLLGLVTLDKAPYLQFAGKVGILSEEMGLGKTVEMISLISLHRRQAIDSPPGLKPGGATLIITPPSILQQWISEIHKHAPTLTVFHYKGIKAHKNQDLGTLVENLATQDIVVSTYSVLAAEIHFTPLNPEKTLRHESKYPRKQSPLMQISWWRCLMDEAQMIETGVSNAAVVARMIPRVNAWCVTGTPVRKEVNDLLGLLVFLRLEPYTSAKHVWSGLISNHKIEFQKLFGSLALRHSKREVRDELRLPAQRRYVITMPFTPVEEQNYSSLFKQMCEDAGLDIKGHPISDDWDRDAVSETMRRWLMRLRQTALHPEVGHRNRRALGNKEGPLRTVDQVLEIMFEQTDQMVRADHRALLLLKLKRGQVYENSPRVTESLAIWSEVEKDALSFVEECREQLNAETNKSSSIKGDSRDSAQEDLQHDDESELEVAATSRRGVLSFRLRNTLEVHHIATFFIANAYFQLKENLEKDSPEFVRLERHEVDGYEKAKKIRREILDEVTSKTERMMKGLVTKAATQSFTEIPDFDIDTNRGGLESRRLMDQMETLATSLNRQAEVIDDWRENMIQLLTRPLVDEDEGLELTGDEYEDSTKIQEELLVYSQALQSTIADRHDTLNAQQNKLIEFDAKISLGLAQKGEGPFPEKMIELMGIRTKTNPRVLGSVRGTMTELRALASSLRDEPSARAQQELQRVEKLLAQAQKQFVEQTKVIAALEKEVEIFTKTTNSRIEFYRQLQQISDLVAAYDGPVDDNAVLRMVREENDLAKRISAATAKRRYLQHLRGESTKPTEQRICVICRESFELGALTVCGHLFCAECIKMWWRAHRNCPICKRKLKSTDLHDITYKPQELSVELEHDHGNSQERSTHSESSSKAVIYQQISKSKLSEIRDIELNGPSFGTKIDTLARHLIWLRQSDPGAKSIVFSQFTDFLITLASAFLRLRIGFASADKPGDIERFKEEPDIEVLLLNARAQSSGLNLTNASHVFLCEPLLNTALELQAIARVDRIGQEQETNVWLYLIDGSVEQSIHQLAVRRRMEHIDRRMSQVKGKAKASNVMREQLEEANSMELETSLAGLLEKGVKSGEMVENEDLWECLFGGEKAKTQGASGLPTLHNDLEISRHLRAEAATLRASGFSE